MNKNEIHNNKNFKKKDANVIRSITCPINEHHDQIKRKMLSFLNINQSLLETSSQNFIFKYQLSLKADVTD